MTNTDTPTETVIFKVPKNWVEQTLPEHTIEYAAKQAHLNAEQHDWLLAIQWSIHTQILQWQTTQALAVTPNTPTGKEVTITDESDRHKNWYVGPAPLDPENEAIVFTELYGPIVVAYNDLQLIEPPQTS
ncbi:MAG: hypothetical protein WC184_12655 [Acidimicrobiia bacterium]